MKPEIYIKDDSITIGQLLKKIGLNSNKAGGAKFYLESNKVLINNKKPEGRNTKVKNGDLLIIIFKSFLFVILN
ncbi:RNA-binding S4 domain-containing protein [Mycoplasmopsis bovis]|nr:RNA-binding S4 domain-containing protein [Mycoplasmopsis bovis]QQH54973.1 RNA-binding S4 domain-containing protein [Mycoplasmopsis bovis]